MVVLPGVVRPSMIGFRSDEIRRTISVESRSEAAADDFLSRLMHIAGRRRAVAGVFAKPGSGQTGVSPPP